MRRTAAYLTIFILSAILTFCSSRPVRVLVITGGHGYNVNEFNNMLSSLGPGITFQVAELPSAFEMFEPDKRNQYDVLMFYHMWQTIDEHQKKIFSECISEGKPVVALHHSICAFDDWPEYWDIIGGKYFHKPTIYRGKEFPACSYIHDIHFNVRIKDKKHPVTKGINDFEIYDETYKGYYVDEQVTQLLTTDEPTSTPVIGWATKYGKSKIVVFQSGHDVPTFQNQNFRQLLKQAVMWVAR